jgi:ABC-type uncharacterized transport system fused permease/ATPase subunit
MMLFCVVLDEATSQVGLSMEQHLYTKCRRLDITLLSVGHRDSLRQFHQRELHIDGTSGGWQMTDIVQGSQSNISEDIVNIRF